MRTEVSPVKSSTWLTLRYCILTVRTSASFHQPLANWRSLSLLIWPNVWDLRVCLLTWVFCLNSKVCTFRSVMCGHPFCQTETVTSDGGGLSSEGLIGHFNQVPSLWSQTCHIRTGLYCHGVRLTLKFLHPLMQSLGWLYTFKICHQIIIITTLFGSPPPNLQRLAFAGAPL